MNSPIYIPEPCHENWNQMSPTEKGRFCKVCTKEVVDFTNKSPQEVLTHLSGSSGTTCGQFTLSQLNRRAQQEVIQPAKNPFRKWMLSALAMMGMVGWFKESKAQLKGKVAIRGEVDYVERHNIKTESSVIHGNVTEQYGNRPVAGAVVKVYSGDVLIQETKTIANGSYKISIPPGKINMNLVTIVVEHMDFFPKEIADLSLQKKETRLNVVMEEEIMMLGEVAFVPEEITEDTIIETVCSFPLIEDTLVENPVLNLDTIIEITNVPGNTLPEKDTVSECTQDENLSTRNPVITATFTAKGTVFNSVIYPNPVTETAVLETGFVSAFRIRILDATGKLMGTEIFTGQKTQLTFSEFPAGIYFIEVSDATNGNKTVLRVIKP